MADDIDLYFQEKAAASTAAGRTTPAKDAVNAFKDGPEVGVPPVVAMGDGGVTRDLAAQRREQEVLRGSPQLQRFAARSPAHVAATRGDWPAFSALGAMSQAWADYTAPIKEAAGRTAQAARDLYKPAAPKNLVEGLVPGFGPRDRALGGVALGALETALSPVFQGPANVLARPLSAVPGRQAFTWNPTAPFRPLTQPEAQREIAGDLLEAISPPLFRTMRPPIRDLGTATEVGGRPRIEGPRETVPEADFEPIRPPGVRPQDTARYGEVAKADADAAAQMQEAVANLPTHKEVPALVKEFLDDAGATETVWVDAEAIQQLYFEGHTPFSAQSRAVGEALASGREVELSMSDWLTETAGTPYAQALLNATRFRDDGVSVDQASALAERDSLRAEAVPEVRGAEGEVGEGVVGGEADVEGGEVDVRPTDAEAPPPAPEGDISQRVAAAERAFPEDIEPTPQLRELAARADAAVDEVFAELRLSELFDLKALKLSKPRFANYDAMVSEAQAAASERVLEKVYAQVRRERTPEWKDNVSRQFAALTAELPTSRLHTARMALQFNQGPLDEPLETPPLKLSRSQVSEEYGPTVVETLPRGMFGAGGVGADDAASVLGYSSGEELLSELLDSESAVAESGIDGYRAWLKWTLGEAAADAARAELGFDISPEAMREAALEAAVLPSVEDLLSTELRAAAEELGLPFDKEAVRAVAQAQFDTMPTKEALRVRRFEKGMWQTGEKAARALEKGDFTSAFRARQQQLLNFYQLDAAHALRKYALRSQKEVKRLGRESTIRGLSQPFLNQLHAYLPQWGVRVNREPTELAEALGGQTLEDFHTEVLRTNAAFPSIPEVEPALLEDLTVTDYRTVTSFIHALNRYGRELQTARTAEKREDFDAVVQEALASVPPGKPPKGRSVDGRKNLPQSALSAVNSYDASHRKVADFVEWMDRGSPTGVWAQNTWMPMYAGADVEGMLRREMYGPVAKAWDAVPEAVKRSYNKKLMSPLVGVTVHRRNIVPLALYMGTVESAEKAAAGYGTEPETLLAFINTHITPEEVALVEEVWGRFESLAPRVSETLRSLTGEGLRRVEASPVALGGRTLRGGYWPISYNRDPELNPQVAAWEREREASLSPDGVDRLFAGVLPNKGFAQERTGFIGPVDVELNSISTAFNAHIKYAAYARAVSDVRKFAYEPRIRAAIQRTFGEEYVEVVPGWLEGIVKPYQATEALLKPFDAFFNKLARNMSVGTLAFSYGTMVAQAAGVANAIAVLSDGHPLAGVGRMLGGYGNFLQAIGDIGPDAEGRLQMRGLHAIFERSEFMRERFGTLEQNMTEALLDASELDPGHVGLRRGLKHLERIGFQAIGWAEFITVSGPQWLAAEQKALSEGLDAAAAVRAADRSVVKAQGSGRRVDLSAVQRFQGIGRMFYAFQSYFNQQYQLSVDIGRNLRGAGMGDGGGPPESPTDAEGEPLPGPEWDAAPNHYNRAKAVLLLISILILGGAIDSFLRGRKWKPTDALWDFFRPMIFVNTFAAFGKRHVDWKEGKLKLANMYDTGFGDDLWLRFGEIITKAVVLGAKMAEGKEPRRPVQTLADLGRPLGVPGAAQIGRTGEFLYQWAQGKQSPDEWTDIYLGLTGGPQPRAAKSEAKGSTQR